MYGNGKSNSDQNLTAWREGREARRRAASQPPAPAGADPDGTDQRGGGGDPMGAGADPAPGVDLNQQRIDSRRRSRQDRAAHALAALQDLEAAIQAEIEEGDPSEVIHLAADWLNDDAMAVIEGLT